MKYILILPLFLLIICWDVYADTILLKDGQELKGVIVEDYHDRIVLSTEKGEIWLLKNNIEKLSYDILEENLVKLGAFYRNKGDYNLALYYYEFAHKLNPNMREAQEGISLVSNMIFRKRESDLEKEVALRQDTEEKMGRPQASEPVLADLSEAKINELWNSVGISIESFGSDIRINKLLKKSPAEEAGIKEGDIIVSVWGRLVRYMPLKDVYDLFLRSSVNELRIVVSQNKSVVLKKNHIFSGAEDMIGARLLMEFEGLTVGEISLGGAFDNAGILKGDRITRIAGVSTRYTPLAATYKLIEGIQESPLDVEIQREFGFWKR